MSLASSRPVPIKFSRDPTPAATMRFISRGSESSSRVCTYCARSSARRHRSARCRVGCGRRDKLERQHAARQ